METFFKMVSGLRENFHQGCNIFAPFNGMQCTAVTLISLILLMNKGVPEFEYRYTYQRDPSFLDLILHEGTSLYGSIIHERGYTGFLGHEQLPRHFTVQNSAQTSLNFGLFGPLTAELAALERLRKSP